MKKGLLLFTLSVIVAVSGYSQSNNSQQVQVAQAVYADATNQKSDYSQSSTVAVSEPITVTENTCDTCNEYLEEKKAPINRAKEVKVVRYNDRCKSGCGFPVTVRIASNCPNEGVQ